MLAPCWSNFEGQGLALQIRSIFEAPLERFGVQCSVQLQGPGPGPSNKILFRSPITAFLGSNVGFNVECQGLALQIQFASRPHNVTMLGFPPTQDGIQNCEQRRKHGSALKTSYLRHEGALAKDVMIRMCTDVPKYGLVLLGVGWSTHQTLRIVSTKYIMCVSFFLMSALFGNQTCIRI